MLGFGVPRRLVTRNEISVIPARRSRGRSSRNRIGGQALLRHGSDAAADELGQTSRPGVDPKSSLPRLERHLARDARCRSRRFAGISIDSVMCTYVANMDFDLT